MSLALGRLLATRKTGRERMVDGTLDLGVELSDFWGWSCSDLVSNTLRGILAEFIVARAIGVDTSVVREEWATYDLRTSDGITIEVKPAAFLQSWSQKRPSKISFLTRKTVAWDADTGVCTGPAKRQSDLYVFALFQHMSKATVNPLDVDQWRFYVVSTARLNERTRSQHSISAKSLDRLAGSPNTYGQLGGAVRGAAGNPTAKGPGVAR